LVPLDAVLLSLKTLASFRMDGVCLLPFVRDCLVHYLDHESVFVRQEAVVACCRLLVDPKREHEVALRGPSAAMVQEVLQRLLQVALADPERTVRQKLLNEIKPHFDRFLRQPVHLETLFLFLSDEDLHIRIETVKLLGRLALLNPGFVLPPLRQTLMRLIIELQLQSDTNAKEQAAWLLSEFLRAEALHRLVRPFMRTIVDVLPLRGKARLATVALEALGELCLVMGEEMMPYFQQLMPVILENIQDQSSTLKREVSLRTLGRLVSSTGYVVKPYLQYPDLLPRILSVLREGGNQPWSLRTEILRTVGLLGALDPYRYDALQTYNASLQTSTHRRGAMVEEAPRGGALSVGGAASAGAPASSSSTPLSSSHADTGGLSAVADAHLRLLDDGYADAPAHTIMFEQSAMVAQPSTGILEQESSRLTPANEDYNPKVAISALMRILQDQSLYPYHFMVMNAVMLIFQSLGLRCVPFLAEIIPHMLHVVRSCEPGMRESLLLQLAGLTRIVKVHLHMFLPRIFDLVCDYWNDHTEQVLVLVEEMAVSVREKFRPFVPRLMPLLLKSLVLPTTVSASSGARASQQTAGAGAVSAAGGSGAPLGEAPSTDAATLKLVLRSIAVLQPVLRDNLHLVVPALIKLVDQMNELGPASRVAGLAEWQLKTVTALATLCNDSSLVHSMGFAARITRSLVRLLDRDGNSVPLQRAIMVTFTIVARQLGAQFVHLYALVRQAMVRRNVKYAAFEESVARLGGASLYDSAGSAVNSSGDLSFGLDELGTDGAALSPRELLGVDPDTFSTVTASAVGGPGYRLPMNQHHLQNAWDVTQRSTAEDWNEWIQRFTVELLRESPSPALRACNALARVHPSLARELFHAAFVSCWFELPDDYQANLVMSLERAFQSDSIPPEILQTLLNLAEFMEHDAEALPIDIRTLADLAQTCHAHAKALHYKEHVFQTSPAACVEALISINKKLDQPEAAQGILKYAQKQNTLYGTRVGLVSSVKESWLAKLGNWEEALVLYRRRLHTRDRDVDAVLGCMKCLDALGHWQEVVDLCFMTWDSLHAATTASKVRKKAAALATTAAWNLGQWENMEKLVAVMEPQEMAVEGPFFRAVLAVHRGRFEDCAYHIDRARRLLHNTFSALVSESYKRAYTSMVSVQQLAEIEEVVEYKRVEMDSARADEATILRQRIVDKWQRRLKGCRLEVSAWQRVLKVRSLILSPAENVDSWLQFASLCRQSGNFPLSERILTHHLGSIGATVNGDVPHIGYAPPGVVLEGMLPSRGMFDASVMNNGSISSPMASLHDLESTCIQHRVQYAYYKHLWAVGARHDEALQGMSELANRLSLYPCTDSVRKLLVKSLLKCGDWRLARISAGRVLDRTTQQAVLESYQSAKELDNDSYKGWHAWAMVNFRIMEQLMQQTGRRTSFSATQPRPIGGGGGSNQLVQSAVAAAKGFLRAVALGRKRWSGSVQQDLLNLLNVWFWYGHLPDLFEVLAEGFQNVCLDAWLGVLPQLIARINAENETVRTMLHDLLSRLGSRHPQALVYPLSVALKSHSTERKAAAEKLLHVLHAHSQQLVDQARQVSLELIRVAILWHEQWHEGLEEASRLYFGDGNVRGMLDTLLPLHAILNEGATTHREASFQSAFGRELNDAQQLLIRYQHTVAEAGGTIPTGGGFRGTMPGNNANGQQRPVQPNDPEGALNSAWDLYYNVFRRINKQLPQLTNLELQYVSPYLLNARQLELAVPGTYRVDRTAVRIQTFGPTVQVITSKQRPRKITMHGEDGHDYVFLLKGHEDLRQDERAMQLFGLVNALLESDRRTNKHDLSIQRYAVTPLSHNAGVVGWVPNTDTLHALIRDYRESRKILLNIEHRLMVQMAPDYDMLTLMQKLEVFETALQNTAGQDLYRVLWLKSNDSEQWLDRRTCYTRSLAVMSMVGYILGLGDRHPSNLMLDRNTGKILHIDFGDCFEVAMHRDKFPEKIPFRLTRMMVNAMEVSGIEGNYRSTCEHVMSVLRDNRDSLLAMLQAFVHDPLISWRLLGTQHKAGSASTPTNNAPSLPSDHSEPGNGAKPTGAATVAAVAPSANDNRVPTNSTAHEVVHQSSSVPAPVLLPVVAERHDRKDLPTAQGSNEEGSDGRGSDHDLDDDDDAISTSSSGRDLRVTGEDEGPSIPIDEAITPPGHVAMPVPGRSGSRSISGRVAQADDGGDDDDDEEDGDMLAAKLESGSTVVDARFASIQNLAQSLRNQSSTRMPHETASVVGGSVLPSVRDTYRSTRERELGRVLGPEGVDASQQALNEKALTVIRRVRDKLTGQDFSRRGAARLGSISCDVSIQVEMLIAEATSNERLCQCFVGWCPFW
jgi:FKBP12-rapamycin complex-associated protein